jgi:hypothetical protein
MNIPGERRTLLPKVLPFIGPGGEMKSVRKKSLIQKDFSASAGLLAIKETGSLLSCPIREGQNSKPRTIQNPVATQHKNIELIGSFETEEHGYLVYKYIRPCRNLTDATNRISMRANDGGTPGKSLRH